MGCNPTATGLGSAPGTMLNASIDSAAGTVSYRDTRGRLYLQDGDNSLRVLGNGPGDPPLGAGALRVLSNDGPMLYNHSGLAMFISGAGTLLCSSALPHASAAPSATAHALYSRSRPCFHAQSTCWPSLAAKNRRNDSARNANADPVAVRAESITLYRK